MVCVVLGRFGLVVLRKYEACFEAYSVRRIHHVDG